MASALRPILVSVCYVNFSMLIRHLNLVYMDEIKQINHLYENPINIWETISETILFVHRSHREYIKTVGIYKIAPSYSTAIVLDKLIQQAL